MKFSFDKLGISIPELAPEQDALPEIGEEDLQNCSVHELARKYTGVAVMTLAKISSSERFSAHARINASVALLEYGWGKPAQLQVTVNPGQPKPDAQEEYAQKPLEARIEEAVETARILEELGYAPKTSEVGN